MKPENFKITLIGMDALLREALAVATFSGGQQQADAPEKS